MSVRTWRATALRARAYACAWNEPCERSRRCSVVRERLSASILSCARQLPLCRLQLPLPLCDLGFQASLILAQEVGVQLPSLFEYRADNWTAFAHELARGQIIKIERGRCFRLVLIPIHKVGLVFVSPHELGLRFQALFA